MGGHFKWRRHTTAAVALTLLLGTAAGCSTGTENKSKADGETPKGAPLEEKPFKITMMNQMVLAEPPKPDSAAMKWLQKQTNTDLQITWVPASTYTDKTSATIASGEMPMVLLVQGGKPPVVVNAVRAGAFWEVGPYLKDYPNLDKYLNKDVLKSTAIDGKIYSIFRSRSLVVDSMIYRKDWLDNLGLKPPTTVDEIYEVVKAFTKNDPEKSGVADKVGMTEESSLRGFNLILAAYGAGNQWEVINNKLEPVIFSKPYLDALKFYRKVYGEKLLSQDFSLLNRNQKQELVNKGKAGFLITAPDQATRHSELLKVNPKAKLEVTSKLNGVNGPKVLMGDGYVGLFMFPKSSVKTEKELRSILQFFDQMSDPESQSMFEWGIDGVHYTLKDGKPTRTKEMSLLFDSEMVQLATTLEVADGSAAMKGDLDELTTKYRAAREESKNNLVINPAAAFLSDTLTEKGNDLDKIIGDGRNKYIMGQLDDAGWNNVLEQWRKAGGNKVIEEMNAQYQKSK